MLPVPYVAAELVVLPLFVLGDAFELASEESVSLWGNTYCADMESLLLIYYWLIEKYSYSLILFVLNILPSRPRLDDSCTDYSILFHR